MRTLTIVFGFCFCLAIGGFFTERLAAQTSYVKGPKSGSVASGVMVTTDNFSATAPVVTPGEEQEEEELNDEVKILPTPPNVIPPLAREGSNYFEQRTAALPASRPLILKSFQAIPMTNFLPPDPIMAVGPNHVIAAVNSSFRIFDKNGNILKTINANTWFNSTISGASVSDPIVKYDHFAKRWIFAVINTPIAAGVSYILLSVSDDENPLGTWYNWALPAFTNGDSTVSNGTDYEQVGFDSLAIYITGRQFSFGTNQTLQYSKVRILDKSKVYANTAGQITWTDFWDFRDPNNVSAVLDGIRPYVAFGNAGAAFLINASPYSTGTFFTLWTILNPVTNPTITGMDVPVTQFSQPPSPNQLGGGTPLIEGGGSTIRNDAVYRDSALWAVHIIGSGPGNAYSAVRYVKMNPFTGAVLEDVALGQTGYWHTYPAIMPDKDKNIIVTFSRSAVNEYIGAFVSGRKANDPPGLASSVAMKVGAANYILTGSGTRNRWGDYSGIGLDPVEPGVIWAHAEYVASANTWGTWLAKVEMVPLPGSILTLNRPSVNFGYREAGNRSDTLSVSVMNNGTDTLSVSNIALASGQNFKLISMPVLPLKLGTFDSAIFRITFAPTVAGNLVDTVILTSNDAVNVKTPLALSGIGFTVATAKKGILYVTSGVADGGRLLAVNSSTGAVTPLGSSGYSQVSSLEVDPISKKLVGIGPTGTGNALLLLNSAAGDAYPLSNVLIDNPTGMVFKQDGTLYLATIDGKIFTVNMRTGDTTMVTSTGLTIAGLAFNPINGSLWASVRPTIIGKDKIYKIDIATGNSTLVGSTGLGTQTPDIIFDSKGNLFGIIGTGSTINSLIKIDTSTGIGTIIGSMGIASVQSMASSPDSIFTGVAPKIDNTVPREYSLSQNFPNPFNPTTTISFDLPNDGHVTIKVMNVLGEEVATLVNGGRKAGRYRINFDARNFASGIYFYELRANEFVAVKKMVLLK